MEETDHNGDAKYLSPYQKSSTLFLGSKNERIQEHPIKSTRKKEPNYRKRLQ